MQRLTPQSAEAQKQFDALGISAYDANGNFVGLAEFAGQLQTKMRDLTPEARNAALSVMFGSDAVRAASVLYDQGAQGILNWTNAVDDQGYAAEQAAIRMNNLSGDLEALSGSFETALIGLGEGANGPLRSIVQGLDGAVDSFNNMSDGAKQATLALVGGGGLVLLGVAGLGKMTIAVSNTLNSLQSMGAISEATSGRIAAGLGKATKAVGVLGAAYGAAAIAAQALGKESEPLSEAQWADALANGADLAAKSLEGVGGEFYNLQSAYDRLTSPSNVQKLDDWSGNLIGMNSSADLLTDQFTSMGQALANLYASDPVAASAQFNDILGMTGGTTDELLALMPAYRDTLLEAKNATDETAESTDANKTAMDVYTEAMSSGGATIDEYTSALEELIAAQAEAAGVVMDLWSAQNQLEEAYATATQAITDNGATLDVTTEKGRANREALMGVSDAGWSVVESMRQNGATQAELQGQVQATRDRFVDFATKMGMSADQANALADQLNLIPANITPTVALKDNATPVLDGLLTRIDRLDGRIVTTNLVTNEKTYRSTENVNAPAARATGGAIYGPGSGTSDTAGVFALSNGEHVLTASDVTKLGGQGAVHGLRAAIQSGRLKGYASGGSVPNTQYIAPASAPPVPAVNVSPEVSLAGSTVLLRVGDQEMRGYVESVAQPVANRSVALASSRPRR